MSSLRGIVKQAGVSPPQAVRSVKADAKADKVSRGRPGPRPRSAEFDANRCLQILLKDPSLRSNEAGRLLLRALSAQAFLDRDLEGLVRIIPEYDLPTFEQLAWANSMAWRSLAELAGARRKRRNRTVPERRPRSEGQQVSERGGAAARPRS